jgi:hypothetical protein
VLEPVLKDVPDLGVAADLVVGADLQQTHAVLLHVHRGALGTSDLARHLALAASRSGPRLAELKHDGLRHLSHGALERVLARLLAHGEEPGLDLGGVEHGLDHAVSGEYS